MKGKRGENSDETQFFASEKWMEEELVSKTQKSLAGHGAFVYIIKALSGVFGPLAQLVRACA